MRDGAAALAGPAPAQWSSNAGVNLVVADGAGDQVQPKTRVCADGSCWVSFYDGIGGGYDVRIQRLDWRGNKLLGPDGVLVADVAFSSTQDYGLDVDADGNAIIIFRDTRGSANAQITANKVRGIRAALCNDLYTARWSRLHNDANVLSIGARVVGDGLAEEIVRTWFDTEFEGGRHVRRLDEIATIEQEECG